MRSWVLEAKLITLTQPENFRFQLAACGKAKKFSDRKITVRLARHCRRQAEHRFAGAPAIDSALAEWRIPFDTMINGAIFLTRGCAPLMKRGGRIIHVTSIHGERAEVRASAYSMAKAALNQYCRALALELAPAGILVNAIAPGFIDTPMSVVDGVSELDTLWFRANYIEGHHLPLKRAGKPDEIAGVAHFLAGPDASYLTGQVITVDGGLTITF